MNKKVEGLVEWTQQTIRDHLVGDRTATSLEVHLCLTAAKAILSHPDLALIDRERMSQYLPTKETYCFDAGWLPVIPLAEALKEEQ